MRRLALAGLLFSVAAPVAFAEELACGPAPVQAHLHAREAEARLARDVEFAREMPRWIVEDYEAGAIDHVEESRLLAEAEEELYAAETAHSAATAHRVALDAQMEACKETPL
ncbi:hypothetical protein [Hyphomonas sp.]|uniref:hypothetical protein n=1 Tax=Hyphomonas sp. TaxID=87 RepID=UPI00391D9B21